MAEYRLGVQLHGHADDVRGICVCGDAGIATSSRDRTVKFWTRNPEKESEYVLSKTLAGHSSFVGPLAWIPPSDRFPEGGIVSGGMDTFVFLWDLHKGEVVETMKGHNSQVTGLAVDTNGDIISSSMDCTVRHWRHGNAIEVWEAHKVAVQTVLKLSTGELFTGSNDSTIKLWKGRTCIQTFSGHADTVRCLAEMPGLGILSASHDSTVKLWALTGQPLLEMIGHSSLVYSVDAHSSGLIASGSEDRSLKIWKDGVCVQSIEHPGCIWDVKFFENGDIVTACSDGTARIWTTHANRFCSDEELAAYTDLIYQYTLTRKTVGGLKLMDLPRVEALQVPENVDAVAAILKVPVLEFDKGWRELIGERKIKKIFNIDIYKKDPEQLVEYAVDGEAIFLVKLRYVNGKVSRRTPTGRWSQSHGPCPVSSSNLVTYYLFQFARNNVKSKNIKMWQYTFVHGDKECVICLIRGLMTKFFNFSIATIACEALVQKTAAGQEDAGQKDADDCCDIIEEFAKDKVVPLQRLKQIAPYDCQRVLLCLGNKYNELIQGKERSTLINNENIEKYQCLEKRYQCLEKRYQCLEKRYVDVCADNKKLNNDVIEMKGNIRVMCRLRPLNALEIEREDKSVIEVLSQQRLQLKLSTEISDYKFDCIFHPEATQDHIFREIEPVVKSALHGFNVCIFAYGQSGSGKTYTMEGTVGNSGISSRAFEQLFKIAQSSCKPYNFWLSILEISKDGTMDLLSSKPREPKEVHEVEPGRHEVAGLTTIPITSLDQISSKLACASRRRSIASTQLNEQSSRSHCMIKVTVRSGSTESYLWLVDLAGCERVDKSHAEGEQFKETVFINKSLTALRDVMAGLLSKAPHVPYRNSTLTRLLQFSIGSRDSKAIMLVHISPSSSDISETTTSLKFAKDVRGVERAPATRTGNSPCPKLFKSPPLLPRKSSKDPQSAGSLLRLLTAKKSSRPPLGRPPRPPDIN